MATDDDIEREILAKGLTAARVTPESIAAKISSEYYFTAANGIYGAVAVSQLDPAPLGDFGAESLLRLTICVLVLENGFTILGKSAPASAGNFDPELGRKIARADAVNQIWPLEGYLLREQLHVATKAGELDEYGAGVEQIAEACHDDQRLGLQHRRRPVDREGSAERARRKSALGLAAPRMSCQGTMHISGFVGRKVSSLSRDELMKVQRLVGMQGKAVDGRDTPLTRQRIEAYERKNKLGHFDKNHTHALIPR